jgi:hypothetical protein
MQGLKKPPRREFPFVLINLLNGQGFTFIFPTEISLSARADWRAQNITAGSKPLLYGNTEPEELRFDSLWLDSVAAGESLSPLIVKLVELTKKMEGAGTPPPLLASWGDTEFLCVMQEVTIKEKFFNSEGKPLRAEVSMTLLELQEENQPQTSQPSQTVSSSPSAFPSGQVSSGSVFGPEP